MGAHQRLRFVEQGAGPESGQVLSLNHVAVAVVLAPAAATLSGLAQLARSIVRRDQATMGIILLVDPLGCCDTAAARAGFDLLQAMVGRNTEGMLKAAHELSWRTLGRSIHGLLP
jgi:hypothetical protein